eukprot:Skav230769  [mRNA]  locus=scaffold1473:15023:16868:- [translate_table: standard]
MKNFLAVKCDDAKEAANLARQSSDDIKAALQTMEYRLEALEALTIHPKQRSQHPSESATQEPMDVEAEDEKMREHQGPAESFVSQRAQELNEQIERFRQVDTGALDDDAVLQHVLELSQAEAELERATSALSEACDVNGLHAHRAAVWWRSGMLRTLCALAPRKLPPAIHFQ